MRIQKLAEKNGVSRDTIRFWESLGLLRPSRAVNGYRVYGEEDFRRVALIRLAKEAGFTLKEISHLLDPVMKEGYTLDDLSGILVSQRERIDRRIEELSETRTRITRILESCPRKAALRDSIR
jgi:DNA-binding transcriptional MerR regulator